MKRFRSALDRVDGQRQAMVDMVTEWSHINSHSENLAGLEELRGAIAKQFGVLGGSTEVMDLPLYESVDSLGVSCMKKAGSAIVVQKRPEAKRQVLLVCHMDTVYPSEDAFQRVDVIDENTLKGPGVTDAKGGIVIMLKALEAFEQCEFKDVGWKVIINADEEMGSPASTNLLQEYAKGCEMALVFEPSLPNGDLVGARKGSGNFTLVARGVSAHAGREPEKGRNAIYGLARCIAAIQELNGTREGLTVNVGMIEGGTALNKVPDLAIAQFNIRIQSTADEEHCRQQIHNVIQSLSDTEIQFELHGGFTAPPKPVEGSSLFFYCASVTIGTKRTIINVFFSMP